MTVIMSIYQSVQVLPQVQLPLKDKAHPPKRLKDTS